LENFGEHDDDDQVLLRSRSPMINAAIVGLGRWGQVLVQSVQERSERIRFVRAVTRTPARAADFAGRLGLPLTVEYEDALSDPKVDAVVIATPHVQHAAQITAAAQAGKHVFVEKPFTLTLSSAVDALQVCERAGVIAGVGFNRRFLPAFVEMKRRLDAGELGELMHVEGIFAANIVADVGAWRRFEAESPAGSMTSLGIHVLDLMIALASHVTEVQAVSQRRAISWEIDDTTVALTRHASGATGYLCTLAQGARLFMLRALCSKGWIELRGDQTLVICDAPAKGMGGSESKQEFPAFDSIRAELESFAAAIDGNASLPITPGDIVNGIATLEGMQMSARDHRPVSL
jgi:predicted dehydrogenase